jgi:hypothetical protein
MRLGALFGPTHEVPDSRHFFSEREPPITRLRGLLICGPHVVFSTRKSERPRPLARSISVPSLLVATG